MRKMNIGDRVYAWDYDNNSIQQHSILTDDIMLYEVSVIGNIVEFKNSQEVSLELVTYPSTTLIMPISAIYPVGTGPVNDLEYGDFDE